VPVQALFHLLACLLESFSWKIEHLMSRIITFYFLFIFLLVSKGFRIKLVRRRLTTSLKMGATKSQIYDENMYNKPIEGITLTEGFISLNGRKIAVSRWTPISPKAGTHFMYQ
jgi:hypothetical protein